MTGSLLTKNDETHLLYHQGKKPPTETCCRQRVSRLSSRIVKKGHFYKENGFLLWFFVGGRVKQKFGLMKLVDKAVKDLEIWRFNHLLLVDDGRRALPLVEIVESGHMTVNKWVEWEAFTVHCSLIYTKPEMDFGFQTWDFRP